MTLTAGPRWKVWAIKLTREDWAAFVGDGAFMLVTAYSAMVVDTITGVCPRPPARGGYAALVFLGVFHRNSVLCGAFVWARRTRNRPFRWFSAPRAVTARLSTTEASANQILGRVQVRETWCQRLSSS